MNKIERLKKFGILLIGILNFQLAVSQENYIPGYVIKNNVDTLVGLVDYRDWKQNPSKVIFKTKIENKPTIFTPTDITEFKVDGNIYVSGIIYTEVSPTQINKLVENPQVNLVVDTTFLQTLFRGKKSLYYFKNSDGKENFYIKQNTDFNLLVYKRYLKWKNGKRIIAENKKYLGQLAFYLNDCETINSELENTSYNQNSLVELFQNYYKCSSSNISFEQKEEKIHMEIGIVAGASMTSLKFHSDDFSYLVNTNHNSSTNPAGGLFLDLILPRNQNKWSIYNEFLFSTYQVIGSHEEYENENNYSVSTTEIGYSYIKIYNLVRFKYPINNLYLFLNGGISNGFSVSETNYRKEESKFYTTDRVVEELALSETRKYEQGFVFGTGIKYNRFSLELRYERGNGMSKYSALNSSTKRYYLLLGYRF